MKIVVCDDEEYYVNNILERIRNFGVEDIQPNKFDGFTDPEEFMESFKFVRYDLVYLDIEFKEKNGIEMAYQIKDIMPECIIVFVSGYSDYIPESYWVGAAQFITKPIKDSLFEKELRRSVDRYTQLNRCVVFNTSGGTKYIKTDDIVYIETSYDTYKLFTPRTQYFGNSKSIKQTKKDLLNYNFYQLNRSIIINFKHVDTFTYEDITMTNKHELHITKKKRKDFKVKYREFINKEL